MISIMSQIDDENISWQSPFDLHDFINELPVTGITSRDQIINPYDYLDHYHFGNGAQGRREYNEFLGRLQNIQAQQQASYDEWYNSPEQQAIRDREAGLNPDLVGLSGSEVPQTGVSQINPTEGLPTTGEQVSSVVQGITSIIGTLSSVASLATAFSTLPLTAQQSKNAKLLGEQLGLQNESLGLQNEQQLGLMMARDISDLLATAQQVHLNSGKSEPFDLDGWFAHDDNFAPLGAIYGNNPRYAPQLAKQREAVLNHMKEAASAQKDLASSTYGLGQIISSPYYSPDQKLTMIQLKPFTAACAAADLADTKLRETLADIRSKYASGLNVQTAIDVANNQNKYQSDFYAEAQGSLVAAFEQFLRDSATPAYELEKNINQGYLDMFNSDPSGEGAWKASYLYGSKGGSSWKEAYYIRFDESFKSLIDSELAVAQATGDYASLNAMITAFDSILATSASNPLSKLFSIDPNFVKIAKKYRDFLRDEVARIE